MANGRIETGSLANAGTQEEMKVIYNEARVRAVELSFGTVFQFTLIEVIEVGVLQVLDKEGPGATLSAEEIVNRLPKLRDGSVRNLERHLRLLACHDVLTESSAGVEGERRYGLTPLCDYLIDKPGAMSLSSLYKLLTRRENLAALSVLDKSLTDSVVPFAEANGMSFYECIKKESDFNSIMQKAMTTTSLLLLDEILNNYDFGEFEGKTVVDVGGGNGITLERVNRKWPKIRGINFDMPNVIEFAPKIPGVEHQGGDMFVSVPSGDAMMVKFVLHNWADAACIKLLNNCYKALPPNGKMIVVDSMVGANRLNKMASKCVNKVTYGVDMTMLTLMDAAGARTFDEIRSLLQAAEFQSVKAVLQIDYLFIIEGRKV